MLRFRPGGSVRVSVDESHWLQKEGSEAEAVGVSGPVWVAVMGEMSLIQSIKWKFDCDLYSRDV